MKLCNKDWTEIGEDRVFSSVTRPHPRSRPLYSNSPCSISPEQLAIGDKSCLM